MIPKRGNRVNINNSFHHGLTVTTPCTPHTHTHSMMAAMLFGGRAACGEAAASEDGGTRTHTQRRKHPSDVTNAHLVMDLLSACSRPLDISILCAVSVTEYKYRATERCERNRAGEEEEKGVGVTLGGMEGMGKMDKCLGNVTCSLFEARSRKSAEMGE